MQFWNHNTVAGTLRAVIGKLAALAGVEVNARLERTQFE